MEEYDNYDNGEALAKLVRLCDELGLDHFDSEAMARETHIIVDTKGNPHECWETGAPGYVNVVVAMTPEQAVRITDIMAGDEGLTDENRKLRLLAKAMRTYQYMDTDADPLAALQLSNAITVTYDELGIEAEVEVPDAGDA